MKCISKNINKRNHLTFVYGLLKNCYRKALDLTHIKINGFGFRFSKVGRGMKLVLPFCTMFRLEIHIL